MNRRAFLRAAVGSTLAAPMVAAIPIPLVDRDELRALLARKLTQALDEFDYYCHQVSVHQKIEQMEQRSRLQDSITTITELKWDDA